jgi:rhodanese-related sulfurtransferase
MKRALAATALILGGLAAFAGSPYLRPKEISAVQLAQWIKDRRPGLRIIDLRSKSEFDAFHVPMSVHESASVWPRASARDVPAEAGTYTETVVITDDASSIPSGTYILRGGVDAWRKEVLSPKKPTVVTRYFGGVRRGGC